MKVFGTIRFRISGVFRATGPGGAARVSLRLLKVSLVYADPSITPLHPTSRQCTALRF